jgi:hypothetical protein
MCVACLTKHVVFALQEASSFVVLCMGLSVFRKRPAGNNICLFFVNSKDRQEIRYTQKYERVFDDVLESDWVITKLAEFFFLHKARPILIQSLLDMGYNLTICTTYFQVSHS